MKPTLDEIEVKPVDFGYNIRIFYTLDARNREYITFAVATVKEVTAIVQNVLTDPDEFIPEEWSEDE
jgi:hypothetical protein